jgi:hypothetical protein
MIEGNGRVLGLSDYRQGASEIFAALGGAACGDNTGTCFGQTDRQFTA